jgi:hypothetical protein
MKSQTEQILTHLKKGKTITPLTALNKFGCLRLSGRIFDLRDEGYNIKTIPTKKGKKQFATYKLVA